MTTPRPDKDDHVARCTTHQPRANSAERDVDLEEVWARIAGEIRSKPSLPAEGRAGRRRRLGKEPPAGS